MKVSIVTTCFNREKTIRDTIESVLSQSYPNIEYIVVDGASTDGTMSIVNEYRTRLSGGGWAVLLIHGIQGMQANGSYSPLGQDAFKGSLDFLNHFSLSIVNHPYYTTKNRRKSICGFLLFLSGGKTVL